MRIESSENFCLAFNALIRLYKQNYDVKLLALLHRICNDYLSWFGLRVVFCAVRDLINDKEPDGRRSLPEKQKAEFDRLLYRLMRQCITLEYKRCESDYTKEEALCELGQQMGFIPGVYERTKFESFEEFLEWIKEKGLDEPVECRLNYDERTLPIRKYFLKDFGEICLLMVRYSMETESYMRYSCYSLVYHNVRLIHTHAIISIQKYIKIYQKEEDYWINLKNVLNKELERRHLLEVYSKIYNDSWNLNGVLASCVSKEALQSYEKSREAWWRITVFEEYLKEQKNSRRKIYYADWVKKAKEIIRKELKKYDEI